MRILTSMRLSQEARRLLVLLSQCYSVSQAAPWSWQYAQLQGANLLGALLQGAQLQNADLRGAAGY